MIGIFSSLDRIWSQAHGQTPPPCKPADPIGIQDQQVTVEFADESRLVDDLRDLLEAHHLQLVDAKETIESQKADNANLTLINQELQAKLEQEQAYRLKETSLQAKNNELERKIVELENSLRIETQNRDHFRSLVVQQDAFIKEAKRQITAYKETQKSSYEAKVKEAEHLARQCIKVTDENTSLRTDNLNLTEDNKKFQEQTNRLVEEKRLLEDKAKDLETRLGNANELVVKLNGKLTDLECEGCRTGEMGAYCGGCLGCSARQTEHAYEKLHALHSNALKTVEKRDAELQLAFNIHNQRWNQIEGLCQALRTLKQAKWYEFDKKNEAFLSAELLNKRCQEEVERLRKDHRNNKGDTTRF